MGIATVTLASLTLTALQEHAKKIVAPTESALELIASATLDGMGQHAINQSVQVAAMATEDVVSMERVIANLASKELNVKTKFLVQVDVAMALVIKESASVMTSTLGRPASTRKLSV